MEMTWKYRCVFSRSMFTLEVNWVLCPLTFKWNCSSTSLPHEKDYSVFLSISQRILEEICFTNVEELWDPTFTNFLKKFCILSPSTAIISPSQVASYWEVFKIKVYVVELNWRYIWWYGGSSIIIHMEGRLHN